MVDLHEGILREFAEAQGMVVQFVARCHGLTLHKGNGRKRAWDRARRKDPAYRARELEREAARKRAKRAASGYRRGPYRKSQPKEKR